MAVRGRNGRNAAAPVADKQTQRRLRDRSADKLLDQIVPKKTRKRELHEDQYANIRDEETIKR